MAQPITTPWTKIEGSLRPLIPAAALPPVFAPVPDGGMPSLPETAAPRVMYEPQGDFSDAPKLQKIEAPSKAPKVFASAPEQANVQLTADPMERIIGHKQNQLEAFERKDANPFGSANNHPGFGGKLAHVFSKIGNIAGDIIAPGVMARVPGTDLNRQMEEQGLERGIQNLEGETAKNALEGAQAQEAGAQAANLNEATKEMPGKNAAEAALQNAEAYRAIHPLATSAFSLWLQQNPTGTAQDYLNLTQKPLSQQQADTMNGVWDKIAEKYHLPTGQFKAGMPAADANALSASLNNVLSRGQGAQRITIEQQVADQKVPMLEPTKNPDGSTGFKLVYVQAGQTVTPGSLTPTQGGSVNAPTTTEKNAAAQGQLVHEQIPMLLSEIDKNAAQMGPIFGRWNEFMQGKYGMDNPQFAELRANLMLAASAVALAHARGRLPENLREEFDQMINAPQQTPANLKATLNAIDPWMVKMGEMGGVPGLSVPQNNGAAGANPAGTGKIFDSAKWAKANPKGDVNAAKAYAKSQGYEVK